jgi:hypothetical protein
MSARLALAAALKAALPAWQIVHGRVLDTVRKPGCVLLAPVSKRKVPAFGLGWFTETLDLWVLTASEGIAVEDDLDALLLDVLEVLEPLEWATWDQAERLVLADTYHGYKLTISANVQLVEDAEPEPDNEEE